MWILSQTYQGWLLAQYRVEVLPVGAIKIMCKMVKITHIYFKKMLSHLLKLSIGITELFCKAHHKHGRYCIDLKVIKIKQSYLASLIKRRPAAGESAALVVLSYLCRPLGIINTFINILKELKLYFNFYSMLV